MAELPVRVVTRARRNGIDGERNGRVLIRLTAPTVDGAANLALCRLVAERLGVPARRVSLVRGQRSRDKVVQVKGGDAAAIRATLLDRSWP